MVVNQYIILKTDKGDKSCIYPTFTNPTYTIYTYQKVMKEKRKLHFTEIFQLINEEEMVELEYHYFANLNKSMDLGFSHQCLLISKKERQPNIMCLLSSTHHYLVVMPTHEKTPKNKKTWT